LETTKLLLKNITIEASKKKILISANYEENTNLQIINNFF